VPSWLIVSITIVGVLAIFFSTERGHRLAGRLGLEVPFSKGPARADRAYLLRVCDGDAAAVEQLLEAERKRYAGLSESEVYRRAIRTHMNAHPPELEL
jgi:hypothetical protein